ncbi:hypothetical protein BCR35DRAFT_351877 [Leucosporidium creatinivorum]|uniref:Leucine-rich repeat-containing N-terminal plant-type domain-containing protein n=1 Tax=Leucosporidium creatinivorum TaxID=106004 RepID=A0A1Y2FJK1_9BASI|nr:hypothetical protein BCR35DRAFT_351877 [Leucosporidium creatinivorum]
MTLAPPCLSIRVPGAHSRTQSTPGAFGISTYSHRVPNSRPRRPSEASSLSSVSSSQPSVLPRRVAAILTPDSPAQETLATGGLQSATSDWQGDSDSEHEHAHIALARLSAAPAPIYNRNISTQARRTASIYSVSNVALDLPPSPTGTFVSTLDAHAALRNPTTRSLAPSRQSSRADSLADIKSTLSRSTSLLGVCGGGSEENKRKRGGHLPAYQRHASDMVDVRTVLGEGPGGREEKESDRLKRLYLCPWEALSPKSFRSRFTTSQPSHSLDPEKQPLPSSTSPRTRAQTARLRLLSTLGIALLILLLLTDLLLVNYRAFRPSRTLSPAEAQSLTCTSLFALTAPSDPLAFPCTSCISSITSSTTPSSRTLEQAQVVQFCALKDVYEVRSSNSTLGTSEGWMASTDVCSYGGVKCDAKGRVQELSLVDPNVPSEVPSSLRELKSSLRLLQLNGVDYTGEYVN